jgi:uncharacterized protein (TIGR00251 family)
MLFLPPLESLPFKSHPKGVLFYVKASPKASKDAFGKVEMGQYHPILKIYIKAPAVDGKANDAIIDFFSDHLKIKKADIILESGFSQRLKTFLILNMTVEKIAAVVLLNI